MAYCNHITYSIIIKQFRQKSYCFPSLSVKYEFKTTFICFFEKIYINFVILSLHTLDIIKIMTHNGLCVK